MSYRILNDIIDGHFAYRPAVSYSMANLILPTLPQTETS
jgi:hypothetical protein